MGDLRINGGSRVAHSQNTSVQQDKSRLEQENEGSKGQFLREKGEFYELKKMADFSLSPNFALWYNSNLPPLMRWETEVLPSQWMNYMSGRKELKLASYELQKAIVIIVMTTTSFEHLPWTTP